MIDCPGRFCYPAMLVRAARIPLYSGEETRDLEARYLSPYNYPMTCFFYKRRSAATYLLNQRRRRERLSQLDRLGNDGPEWLSDTWDKTWQLPRLPAFPCVMATGICLSLAVPGDKDKEDNSSCQLLVLWC